MATPPQTDPVVLLLILPPSIGAAFNSPSSDWFALTIIYPCLCTIQLEGCCHMHLTTLKRNIF